MTATAVAPGRYADLSRLPGPTGSQVQRQLATLRARLVARYGLYSIPGRPEELIQQTLTNAESPDRLTRTISIGYGCGTIRVRKHGPDGRTWADWIDLQPNDGWHAQVYAYLDGWLIGKQTSWNDRIDSIRVRF